VWGVVGQATAKPQRGQALKKSPSERSEGILVDVVSRDESLLRDLSEKMARGLSFEEAVLQHLQEKDSDFWEELAARLAFEERLYEYLERLSREGKAIKKSEVMMIKSVWDKIKGIYLKPWEVWNARILVDYIDVAKPYLSVKDRRTGKEFRVYVDVDE
jgi:hypothetical protein